MLNLETYDAFACLPIYYLISIVVDLIGGRVIRELFLFSAGLVGFHRRSIWNNEPLKVPEVLQTFVSETTLHQMGCPPISSLEIKKRYIKYANYQKSNFSTSKNNIPFNLCVGHEY